MLRVGGVEPGRAVLDRVEAVAREIGAAREVGAQEALRGEPFHRVAVQGDDAEAHGCGLGGGRLGIKRCHYLSSPGLSR